MLFLDRNLPVNSSSASEIKNKLKELFEKLNCAARISLALEFFCEMCIQMITDVMMLTTTKLFLRSLLFFVLKGTQSHFRLEKKNGFG